MKEHQLPTTGFVRMLRTPEVLSRRGRGRSSHYEDIKRGLFTPPVRIGARAVGHPEHEVEAINAARVAGKSDEEIREAVRLLIAARKRSGGPTIRHETSRDPTEMRIHQSERSPT